MKLYKTKLGRILNFILIDNKFRHGDQVEVIKNNSKNEKYDKYINKYGIIRNIDYSKKKYMFEVKFENGNMYGFDSDELRKISDKEYFEKYNEYKRIFNNIK